MERVNNFGRVGSDHGSRVSVSQPAFDQVLSFNIRVYHGISLLHFYFFIVHIPSLKHSNNVAILVIRV